MRMRRVLPPERIRAIYESKIRKLAYAKWEESGKPDGRDLEFWFAAEKEQHEIDMKFWGVLVEPGLPNYGV